MRPAKQAAFLLILWTVAAVFFWGYVTWKVSEASAQFDMTIVEGLQLEDPELRSMCRSDLGRLLSSPAFLFRSMGRSGKVVLLMAGLAVWIWWRARRRGELQQGRYLLGALTLLPGPSPESAWCRAR